jgi:hypothetical protein
MAQPGMYAAWCRAPLAIQPFGKTARGAALSQSAPFTYSKTRRIDVVDDHFAAD